METIAVPFQIGAWVERVGSAKDYTTGRKGKVVEYNDDKSRVRVQWLFERSGGVVTTPGHNPHTGKGVRTWVAVKTVRQVEAPQS